MNPSKCYGVYAIVCLVNERIYIGRTEVKISRRWWRHRWELGRGVHANKALQGDWDEFGQDAFEFRILIGWSEYPQTAQILTEIYGYERAYIEKYRGNSYNIVDERNVNRNVYRG